MGARGPFGELAYYSSRGPSPLTPEFKPTLVAPGARILSAWPNEQYAYLNGTSMASPHLAGAAAMLLSADPDMSLVAATRLLTETAAPIGTQMLPNHAFGWGDLDAVALVRSAVPHGLLQGQITNNDNLVTSGVVTVTTPSGHQLAYPINQGHYAAYLQPGDYAVTINVFGYEQVTRSGLQIAAGDVRNEDFALISLPSGRVTGHLLGDATVAADGITLTALGTDRYAISDQNGQYQLSLPVGAYQLQLFHNGLRVETQAITITAGTDTVANFSLEPQPTVLLVSGNEWLYRPRLALYQQALLDNQLAFTEWPVLDPTTDSPSIGYPTRV